MYILVSICAGIILTSILTGHREPNSGSLSLKLAVLVISVAVAFMMPQFGLPMLLTEIIVALLIITVRLLLASIRNDLAGIAALTLIGWSLFAPVWIAVCNAVNH